MFRSIPTKKVFIVLLMSFASAFAQAQLIFAPCQGHSCESRAEREERLEREKREQEASEAEDARAKTELSRKEELREAATKGGRDNATEAEARRQHERKEAQQAAAERRRKAETAQEAEHKRQAKLESERERQRDEYLKREVEREKKRKKEQEEMEYLAKLRSTIKMAAKTCGAGDIRVGGVMPQGKRVIENVRVSFTVHCPGNIGTKGAINYFLGDGMSCVGSDTVNVKIPCKAETTIVTVDNVTRAN